MSARSAVFCNSAWRSNQFFQLCAPSNLQNGQQSGWFSIKGRLRSYVLLLLDLMNNVRMSTVHYQTFLNGSMWSLFMWCKMDAVYILNAALVHFLRSMKLCVSLTMQYHLKPRPLWTFLGVAETFAVESFLTHWDIEWLSRHITKITFHWIFFRYSLSGIKILISQCNCQCAFCSWCLL